MKIIHLLICLLLATSSCKKELVDTSKNDIKDVTSLSEFNEWKESGVALVFFHADWCENCEAQRPAVESVSTNQSFSAVHFIEVNYDDNKDVFKEYDVDGFPQILFFKDGEEQERLIGKGKSESLIQDTLSKYL